MNMQKNWDVVEYPQGLFFLVQEKSSKLGLWVNIGKDYFSWSRQKIKNWDVVEYPQGLFFLVQEKT